jgi:hypothetical protein
MKGTPPPPGGAGTEGARPIGSARDDGLARLPASGR